MKELPFNHKERRIAYKNSVFNIYFDHLEKDGVSLVKDYLVVEPIIKKEDGISGVAILPIKNNCLGLIKIYRHAVSSFCWEVPRGFVDENENTDDAASRELNEETGLYCSKNCLKELGWIFPEPGVISAKVKLYAATISAGEDNGVSKEMGCIDFRWFSRKEIQDLFNEDLINDATTISALFKYFLLSLNKLKF